MDPLMVARGGQEDGGSDRRVWGVEASEVLLIGPRRR